jgi:hypothetical protein
MLTDVSCHRLLLEIYVYKHGNILHRSPPEPWKESGCRKSPHVELDAIASAALAQTSVNLRREWQGSQKPVQAQGQSLCACAYDSCTAVC